jgi:hypothetical protein
MTERFRDWQSRLQACQAERCARPFAWGAQDCALFGADCVLAQTGSDAAADVRGTYFDAAGAARVIRALGGLRAIAAARLGAEVSPLLAQTGDIGLVMSGERECFAVCSGDGWIAPAADGLEHVPMSCALTAWRCVRGADHE